MLNIFSCCGLKYDRCVHSYKLDASGLGTGFVLSKGLIDGLLKRNLDILLNVNNEAISQDN